jgi:hypothetical protein
MGLDKRITFESLIRFSKHSIRPNSLIKMLPWTNISPNRRSPFGNSLQSLYDSPYFDDLVTGLYPKFDFDRNDIDIRVVYDILFNGRSLPEDFFYIDEVQGCLCTRDHRVCLFITDPDNFSKDKFSNNRIKLGVRSSMVIASAAFLLLCKRITSRDFEDLVSRVFKRPRRSLVDIETQEVNDRVCFINFKTPFSEATFDFSRHRISMSDKFKKTG